VIAPTAFSTAIFERDSRPHVCFGLVAAVGDAAHDLLELIVVERRRHLVVRARKGLFGQRVDRRLVVADVQEVRKGADPIERAAQKELIGDDAGEIERG
jgi:hypothetical protein